MPKKVLLLTGIIVGILAIVFLFIDFTVSVGMIVGFLFSLIYLGMLTYSFKGLNSESENKVLLILSTVLRLFVLAFPMLIAGLFPQYMNLFGVFGGEVMFKVSLYLAAFVYKGGL